MQCYLSICSLDLKTVLSVFNYLVTSQLCYITIDIGRRQRFFNLIIKIIDKKSPV